MKSEFTKTDPDGRPWLSAAVEQDGYQGVANGVLELVEELHNNIKNKLTDFGNLLQNMGGPASTDPELRGAVDQLFALLPRFRQDKADLKKQYLDEAEDPENMELDQSVGHSAVIGAA